MKHCQLLSLALGICLGAATSHTAVITVTTTDNVNPGGQKSLLQALTEVQSGDTIRFAIPGTGVHTIATPADGYPLITKDNVVIDGYSQPGASPNTNTILAANNAQIKIVLDSRNGNSRLMDFPGDTPNDNTGYGSGESAILGILTATNVTIRGLSMVAVSMTGAAQDVNMYAVSYAKGASGRVSGCWIGVTPDGQSGFGYGPLYAVTGFRYQGKDESGTVTNTILVSNVTIGVAKTSTDPRADFNVITSIPGIPIILEGDGSRISGNFLEVSPDGKHDYNPALEDPSVVPANTFEGAVEIGRGGNNSVIGVDGDGVNDAEERNVIGGTLPTSMGGYDHTIEFYGNSPGTNIIAAGNYVGVGVDGTTRFTNGVPAFNASGGSSQYRFGSNLDGVSDAVEGNVVFNLYPASLFPPSDLAQLNLGDLNFFDELSTGASVSYRGNVLVNNYPLPASPERDSGAWLTNYYTQALADVNNGLTPVLSPSSTTVHLVGTVPVRSTNYPGPVAVDVYVADPEGVATGKAVDTAGGTTAFPNGWVQGKTYLGSFAVNDPATGSFDASVAALNLPANTPLTIVANYSKSTNGAANATVISSLFSVPLSVPAGAAPITIGPVTLSGQSLVLSWSGGVPPYQVLTRNSLSTGSWSNYGAPTTQTSVTIPPGTDPQGFYQVQGQ